MNDSPILPSFSLAAHRDGSVVPQQFLTFVLGNEHYGIDIIRVMEIRSWIETTRLPNTPEYIMGVINLRGVVVPILDMKKRFGMESAVPNSKSVVIILHTNDRMVGILVDTVSGILDVNRQDIQSPPPMSYMVDDDFLTGLVALKEQLVVLLDIDKMFSGALLNTAAALMQEQRVSPGGAGGADSHVSSS